MSPKPRRRLKRLKKRSIDAPTKRGQVLRQLFDEFLSNRKGDNFSLEAFWPEAEKKFMEPMDNEEENRMEIRINP